MLDPDDPEMMGDWRWFNEELARVALRNQVDATIARIDATCGFILDEAAVTPEDLL